jgi:hypothetical protein
MRGGHKSHTKTARGNKRGVKGTGGPKRGKRAIRKSEGVAMKAKGKGPMRQSHVTKMEKADVAV